MRLNHNFSFFSCCKVLANIWSSANTEDSVYGLCYSSFITILPKVEAKE